MNNSFSSIQSLHRKIQEIITKIPQKNINEFRYRSAFSHDVTIVFHSRDNKQKKTDIVSLQSHPRDIINFLSKSILRKKFNFVVFMNWWGFKLRIIRLLFLFKHILSINKSWKTYQIMYSTKHGCCACFGCKRSKNKK